MAGNDILQIDELTNDFFSDVRLLGIVATAKNYRFCWTVNHLLNLDFRLDKNIDIHIRRKKRDYFFPVYSFFNQASQLNHYIYHNNFDGEYLLPEFKHINFLWLMKGEQLQTEEARKLIAALKEIPCVQLVAELTNEKIKTKGNLVFE